MTNDFKNTFINAGYIEYSNNKWCAQITEIPDLKIISFGREEKKQWKNVYIVVELSKNENVLSW